jgi:predicted N-acyltransferase
MEQAYLFYRSTCRQFGHWNRQYLNRPFFEHIQKAMPERLQVLLARDAQGEAVAGTLTLRKGDRWYGRYWGCKEEIRFLHFEACYYHPLELAISEGVQVYEPGAGGGHKFKRGFEPVLTYSAHWLADPRFSALIDRFLAEEGEAVQHEVDAMLEHSPLVHPSPEGDEP